MSHSRLIKLFPFLSCPKYENFTQTKRPDTQGCCAGDSMFLLAFMFTHFPQNVSERIAFTTFLLPFASFFGAAESTGWLYDCFSFFYSSLKSSGCVNNFRVFKFFGWFSILFSSTWWQQQILSRVFPSSAAVAAERTRWSVPKSYRQQLPLPTLSVVSRRTFPFFIHFVSVEMLSCWWKGCSCKNRMPSYVHLNASLFLRTKLIELTRLSLDLYFN